VNQGAFAIAPVHATINNSNEIVAQVINNGVLSYGNVINVQNAPNAVQINLLGGGNLWGNIELGNDIPAASPAVPTEANDTSRDYITVSGGRTSFEGIINADQDLNGTLLIDTTGDLFLRDNRS